ncbi:hypothetical protein KJ865_09715, partial [Myxococcota bacterium]|nr:hypothetical protein [Myxococcota bacterium]
MNKRWLFLFIPLFVISSMGNSRAQTKKSPEIKVTPLEENQQIQKEITELRKDYSTFKEGVIALSRTTNYLIKRLKINERAGLEKQIAKDIKDSKVKDIIERAKLLLLLEQRLRKYQKTPDPLWTPELLWRTAVIYHEIAEEREIWVAKEDEKSGKILSYDEEYQDILNSAYKLSKGVIRPADTSLGVNHFRRKAEQHLKELIDNYPKFRAVGSAFHLLARIYEKPPFSEEDTEKKLPAKVSLGAVCSNWGFKPFKDDFKKILTARGLNHLSATALTDYKTWEITDFPSKLPFDVFATCKPVNGSTEFIGTAWATLGKYLSTKMLDFKAVDPALSDEEKTNVRLFNLALTKWSALSAYKRALGPEYKALSTRGYVVYFAGLMMYQNELNQALAMKLFDQVVRMGQNDDENSPHEAAIKYIGFLLQEERIDAATGETKYSWKKPYPLKCEDKCPVQKLTTFFQGTEQQPHVKRIWVGVADFFRGFEENKLYQRSDEDLLHAYNLYDYVFRKMDREGGWRYNPDKPSIFWKMRDLILLQITKYNELRTQVKNQRDKNEVSKKLAYWKQKKSDLYAFAPNVVFRSNEVENFLTEHQKFLMDMRKRKNKVKSVALADLRRDIVNIKSFTLLSTGEVLADKAKDLFYRMKKAEGAEKNALKRKAQVAFKRAVEYYAGIMKDYPNSIYMYGAMVRILQFYCELPMDGEAKKGKKYKAVGPQYYLIDIAVGDKERHKAIYDGLKWGRKVRDSHLGNSWQKNAAVIINYLYEDQLAYKDPSYPFDPKKEKAAEVLFKKKEIPEKFTNYMEDASIYMKMYPKDKNSALFLYKMARIYLHYHHVEKARDLYRTILKNYCSHDTAYFASYDLFLSYKFQKVAAAQEKEFLSEREKNIKYLEKQQCGGDDKHRELMDMIAKLELSELVKNSKKMLDSAEKAKKEKKNDPGKWKKALAHYELLRRKMEGRKIPPKERDAYYENLFGIYWSIYTCKKELEDAQGAIAVLEEIRRKKPILAIADAKGWKEYIFYELAEAYTKSFNDVKAEAMWAELTKTGPKGTWRIKKNKKLIRTGESQFRLMAEEKIFWIYKSRGKKYEKETLKQGEKLIEEFRTRKPLYKKKIFVAEATAYKDVAQALGMDENKSVTYYLLGWAGCTDGKCHFVVTDKSIHFREILFDMYVGMAFEDGASERDLERALERVKSMENAYEGYLPLSKIFRPTSAGAKTYNSSKEYEAMWRTRLNLIYRKATIWKAIMEKNRRRPAKRAKAQESYRELLTEYRKLYEKSLTSTPQLNPQYAVINYGEALIAYVSDKYRTMKNPFKGLSTLPIDVYEEAQLALFVLQKKVSGKGEELNKRIKSLQEKIQKRQAEYIKEIQAYIAALQKLQKAATLSNKDKLKYYNVYKRFNGKYPKFLKDLQKVGVNKAISNLISAQKDIKGWAKQLEGLTKGWEKDFPASTKAYLKKYIPKARKSLKEVEKIFSGRSVAVFKTIKANFNALETIMKTKKNIDFNDLAAILNPLATLAAYSVAIASSEVVGTSLVTGQTLGGRADGYSWYKEQKGYLRKQVALIRGNLLALKMNLLYQGLRIFEKVPYLSQLSTSELEEKKDEKLKEA